MEAKNISQINEKSIKTAPNIMHEKDKEQNFYLFCLDCLQIPEYEIEIDKKTIKLKHYCNDGDKEMVFHSEIKSNKSPEYQCSYCQKQCNSICIECHNYICFNCKIGHLPDDNFVLPQIYFLKDTNPVENKQYIIPYDDIQFMCKTHFYKYKYFCPICKINLCEHCRNYHVHINCYPLLEYKVVLKDKSDIKDDSEDIILNLAKLCKLFEDCYVDAIKKGKLIANIIMNYSLINKINDFISKYIGKKNKKNKRFTIKNTLFNNEEESNHLCDYFYDEKFKNSYTFLIESVNNGDYEYHFKMEVLKEFYKNKKRFNNNYDWNDSSFYVSLKRKIDYFRGQYHYIKEIISTINMNININYLKKEKKDLKLLLQVFETDINLLKKMNMSLLYKYDFQFRRKVGNLMAELILLNYTNLLDPIEETDYVIMETLILLKKKLCQLNNLTGPENIKKNYENDLKKHYTSILEKASSKVIQELKNIKKEMPDMNIMKDNDTFIQFHQSNNETDNINEAVVLNLFFRLKADYASILKDSIHNKTEQINSQIKDELEKFKNMNLSNGEIELRDNKANESISNNVKKEEKKLCHSYFEKINRIKNNMNIKEDITLSNNENVLKLFEPIKQHKYIEENVNQFKSELEKLFKNYNIEDSTNINNASNIYFHREILNILMEKKIYQNYLSLINEMKSQALEDVKNDFLKVLTKVEPMLNNYIKIIEGMKNKAFMNIKQFENYIDFDKNKDEITDNNDPFFFLEKYININLFDIISHDSIQSSYISYLINFYFCADDASKYLKEIKNKYNDAKLIVEFVNIFEKLQLLKIFVSRIKYEENDELKEKWDKLKKEETFVKGNELLNKKIKEYVLTNDENHYLDDLNNINKLKSAKINLLLPDPQHILVRAYWRQNRIPWTIPEGLKITQVNQ